MSQESDTWKPGPAAKQAIQAAQLHAEKLLKLGAGYLLKTVVPIDEVLYKIRMSGAAGNPDAVWHLRIVWPGKLELLGYGGEVTQRCSLADVSWGMQEYGVLLRRSCPEDRILLKARFRRPHSTPMKVTFDAAGVLRVFNARTRKLLAVSAPGEPFKLSPDFNAMTFHDLMPRLR